VNIPATEFAAVIPAYNEAATIHAVATRTLRYIHLVIVVDDGSSDRTAEAIRELPVTVLRHPHNQGKAAALWLGMQYALERGAAAVLTLDGDGQHEPDDIPALIAMHRRDPMAIIIGARFRRKQAIPWLRAIAHRTANFWVSWAAGYQIQDSQSGFRLYPAAVLNKAGSRCDPTSGFAFESEVLIEAGRMGIPIRAVPVPAIYGRHLRRSHFRQMRDVARITGMVAQKLLANRMDIPGLLKSRRCPSRPLASSGPPISAEGHQLPHRHRVLFMAEAVSLAHVARAVALARTLDPDRYDVHLACDRRYLHLFEPLPATVHAIQSIDSNQFQDRLLKGRPLYSATDLRGYVKEELRLLGNLNPDAVIGDFRLSLSVSARIAAVPYMTVTNAHWSPYARQRFIVPELAITERFGPRFGQGLFTMMRPFVFARYTLALNRVRREYGLPSLGYSLPRMFMEADATLYADLPELVPTYNRPPQHHYLGPVLWSPESTPVWWDSLPDIRPMAYVSLGTSGRSDLLPMVLRALDRLGVGALVSTAGRISPAAVTARTWMSRYLPGLKAAARADVVICNGGSATVYQALGAGTPVLGIPSNLDQYLMMGYLQQYGAGEYLRAGDLTLQALTDLLDQILHTPGYRLQADRLRSVIRSGGLAERFEHLLIPFLGAASRVPRATSLTNHRALPAHVGAGRYGPPYYHDGGEG
jgi:UDP:flavonoid glycosyltransferase YjiC (YdhE family)